MYEDTIIDQWFGDETESVREQLGFALASLKNDLRGVEIRPDNDLLGFLIRESGGQYTLFALWKQHKDGTWAASECYADIMKGVDIDDEKYIARGVTLTRACAAIKERHKAMNPKNYDEFIDPSQGVMRKWAHTPY